MSEYEVYFSKSAVKEIESLDTQIIPKIIKKIELLQNNPRPSGCIKLKGNSNLWRIRIGDYRIIYSIDDNSKIVDISAVLHRKDAY